MSSKSFAKERHEKDLIFYFSLHRNTLFMHDDSYIDPPASPYRHYSHDQPLEFRELEVERKYFTAQLRQNERGKFLRIVEETQGRRNTVIVPSSGFAGFLEMINDILSTEAAGE